MNISRRHLLQAVGGIAPLAVIGIPRDAQALDDGPSVRLAEQPSRREP